MPHTQSISAKRLPVLLSTALISVVVLSVSGCISSPQKQNKPMVAVESGASFCQQLQDLFKRSTDGFKSIREQPSYQNKVTLWQSRYQLINNSCEIWQWSDKYSYICNRAMPSRESAVAVYEKALGQVSQCLGQSSVDWQEQQIALENKGLEIQYNMAGSQRGLLKVVNTGGILRDSWTVYFRVDSPDLLNK